MILGRKKAIAALAATAIVASGAMWAPSAHAAPTCVDVPGSTLGATVKVGPVEQRIPAVSGIQICAEAPGTLPVRTENGASGLTVFVGGGTVTVGSITVSWLEDGVPNSETFNPGGVPLPPEQCLLSVGTPAAPYPDCFIALGVDDPTGLADPALDELDEQRAAAEREAENLRAITCDAIPPVYRDGQWIEFCADPGGWTSTIADDGTRTVCGLYPAYDDWGNRYEFCTDPAGWTNAVIDDAYESCNWTVGGQWDPNRWDYVYFCDDPVRWTELAIEQWCNNLCDPDTIVRLIGTIRQRLDDNIKIQIG